MTPAIYRTFRVYLRERFGRPVLRIPVNAGFSCPNRDGVKSREGCAFCDNRSFSPASQVTASPVDQVRWAISRSAGRFGLFIPYLQPFSNTYAAADRLRTVYEPLVSIPGVVGLAAGTRPDCFAAGVMEYLEELATRTYVCVELGLQSAHNSTLSAMNRGHTFADFARTATALARRGIETVAHVILGLPGETLSMMAATAEALASLPVGGVKIHQLMIIRGTRLESLYRERSVAALELGDYADLLCEFLPRLRPDQLVYRLVADSRIETGLVAPNWSSDKAGALRQIHARLEERGVVQGALWTNGNPLDTRPNASDLSSSVG